MTRISIIAAMTDARVIGIENRLPWRLPVDMRWFRQHTLGKPVIMGRATFDSLGRKPLPDRHNIVITRDVSLASEAVTIVNSLDDAIKTAGNVPEVMIIGGATVYRASLDVVNRMYLTMVHADVHGDAWFPAFDDAQWIEVERYEASPDEKNQYACSFVVMDRKVDARRSRPE